MEAADEAAALREALMATRIPVLIVGVLWSGMGMLSTCMALFNLVMALPLGMGPQMLVFGAFNVVTNLAVLAAGVFLVLSGVAGIRARGDARHIASIAKHQANFWRITAGLVLLILVLVVILVMSF